MKDPLISLLETCEKLHSAIPALTAFAPWPDDLIRAERPAAPVPAAALLDDPALNAPSPTRPLRDAFTHAAERLEWQQTYSEAEVGTDFLNRYGFVEIYGPNGHFNSEKARAYLAYWGPGLCYDWHHHPAEELYFVLAGEAQFHLHDQPTRTLGPGDSQMHTANQPHAMTTQSTPVLCYILWRGAGLEDRPVMQRPS